MRFWEMVLLSKMTTNGEHRVNLKGSVMACLIEIIRYSLQRTDNMHEILSQFDPFLCRDSNLLLTQVYKLDELYLISVCRSYCNYKSKSKTFCECLKLKIFSLSLEQKLLTWNPINMNFIFTNKCKLILQQPPTFLVTDLSCRAQHADH